MGCDRLVVGNDDAERDDAVEQRCNDDVGEHKRDDSGDDDNDVQSASSWYATSNMLQSAAPTAAAMRAVRAEDDDLSDDTDLEEEMMRIDAVDVEWRRQLHVNDPVDAQNVFGNWCPATILRIADGDVQLRFLNMNDAWHRWVPIDSGQLAQPATKTRNDSQPVRLAQQIEVRKMPRDAWRAAHVVRLQPHNVRVRYAGRQQAFDDWIPFAPATVAPLGDHTRPLAAQRPRCGLPSSAARRRVLQVANPRYEHYRSALAAQLGLTIEPIEGDGNCLFRSVSHQVYGDDAHHAVVRAQCMDYMLSEQAYFEPYVIGDVAAFHRYVAYKRRSGVWGDDPELQAMCELYDRPAEVFAYDAVGGFRKLRTFHETSSVTRSRPPIRLSYYGGGHYDSLVGRDHAANCIRDAPGEWERRHIEYSRRINTRSSSGDGANGDDATTTGVVQQVAAESDRESTEMAQLEQTLMLSRHEFDGMDASLDETLERSLHELERSSSSASAAPATAIGINAREAQELQVATRESEIAALQNELLAKAKQASEDELMQQAINASLELLPPGGAHDDAFDAQVSAAIQASLGHLAEPHFASGAIAIDDDEQMRRALELSAKAWDDGSASHEVAAATMPSDNVADFADSVVESDDDDELQRAIQASLLQS